MYNESSKKRIERQSKTSESQKKSIKKYQDKLDRLGIRIPKGANEKYKAHAAKRGKSLTALIIELLENDMQKSEKE